MASGPCLRRCRVVRRYMPRILQFYRLNVKTYHSIHVSMYFDHFWAENAVNTGVPCLKVPMHRKLGSGHCTQSEEGRIGPVLGPLRPSTNSDKLSDADKLSEPIYPQPTGTRPKFATKPPSARVRRCRAAPGQLTDPWPPGYGREKGLLLVRSV